MSPVPTFWCEPTGRVRRYLRCYQDSAGRQLGVPAVGEKSPRCRGAGGYCNAMRLLDEIEGDWQPADVEGGRRYRVTYDPKTFPWDAFPTACEACGLEMDQPTRQVFVDEIFEAKTGERAGQTFARREAPVGAMWEIEHYRDIPDWQGPDGMAICVVVPGGEWNPDGRANNCTRPDDARHRCWIRSGDVRAGYLHVDKAGTAERPTCEAGAGSIWMSAPTGWHGFAYRGYLIDADGDQRAVVDRILDAGHPIAPAERAIPPQLADLRRLRAATPRTAAEMRAKLRLSANR